MLRQRPEPALHVGRDRLFNILRCTRLLVMPKRAYHKTTHSHHRFYRHPNLLKAGDNQVIASSPENVWGADIIYLPLRTGTAYVSLVTDAWSIFAGMAIPRESGGRLSGLSVFGAMSMSSWRKCTCVFR
ncbi:hypothetical protein ACQF0C_002362 [Serratia marcescens]